MKRVSLRLIVGAFITLTVLIAAQTANSLYQLSRTQARINTIVALHNQKIDIITRTQVAAHMRTDRLMRMAIESDPFTRDNTFLEFNRAGFLVGSGRAELRHIGMTADEQQNFDAQSVLIEKIESLQGQAIDLIQAERLDAARNLIAEQTIPKQEELNILLAEMRKKVQNENNQALDDASIAYKSSLLVTLVSGGAATLLGMVLGWFSLSRIITSRQRIQQQMSELEASRASLEIEATHDSLTGLANRRLFYDRLEQALLRAKRYQHKIGVLFVDLDRFKSVNDRHGHQIGDALLLEVARRLTHSVRESDTVARSGGDEFMIVLDKLHDPQDCEAVVKQIESALTGEVELRGIKLNLNASVGYALYPDDGDTENVLVRAADSRMYSNKIASRKTRNQE